VAHVRILIDEWRGNVFSPAPLAWYAGRSGWFWVEVVGRLDSRAEVPEWPDTLRLEDDAGATSRAATT
jgi:hypothetical protein